MSAPTPTDQIETNNWTAEMAEQATSDQSDSDAKETGKNNNIMPGSQTAPVNS